MRIGLSEVIVILIVALIVVGPDRLPYYAKKLGQALSQFRKYSDEAANEIKKSVVEPLREVQEPLKEASEPVEELQKEVRANIKDVRKSIEDIGKPAKNAVKPAGKDEEKILP